MDGQTPSPCPAEFRETPPNPLKTRKIQGFSPLGLLPNGRRKALRRFVNLSMRGRKNAPGIYKH
jgi:hypothetical protein